MMKSMKTAALLMGLCLAIGTTVFAQSVSAADNLAPNMLVKKTADKVLAKVQANRKALENDTSKIFALVEDYVLPHFNFTKMSRSVLGKHWHRAKPAQQKAFIKQFQMLLVRTYAVALLNYSNQAIQYLPFRMKDGAKVSVVKTRVTDGNSPPLPIDYLLHRTKQGEWKVVDVKIDGISLVSNYRTSFSQQIRRQGVAGLVKQLEARNAYLAQDSTVEEEAEPKVAEKAPEPEAAPKEEPKPAEPAPAKVAEKKVVEPKKSVKEVKKKTVAKVEKKAAPAKPAAKKTPPKAAASKKPAPKPAVKKTAKKAADKPKTAAKDTATKAKKDSAKVASNEPEAAPEEAPKPAPPKRKAPSFLDL